MDWDALRTQAGGWNESYELAASKYAAIILVPVNGEFLARGQFSLGEAFLARGKKVVVLNMEARKFEVATDMEENSGGDWKDSYGRAVTISP